MGVETPPNQSPVVATVVRTEETEDGFGVWADLAVEDPDGSEPGLVRRVFVPPALAGLAVAGTRFSGRWTLRAGARALVPGEVEVLAPRS